MVRYLEVVPYVMNLFYDHRGTFLREYILFHHEGNAMGVATMAMYYPFVCYGPKGNGSFVAIYL